MQVHDFDGIIEVSDQSMLLRRLHSVRRGPYGAYILSHDDAHPCLFIQVNEDQAYVHYFFGGDHPGYQPTGMTPDDCTQDVHFLQVDGSEGDSIDMPPSTIVSTEVALAAACEFLRSAALPPSISWFEL